MSTQLEFNPKDFSPAALRLIMLRVEQWKCSPSEAVKRLLNELTREEKPQQAA